VPYAYREVGFVLGGTKWQVVSRVVLPRALPGILTGIILGLGRCVSETAAVIFTAGLSVRVPVSLLDPARTMSVHFYILAREGLSMENAYGTAAALVIAILIINLAAYHLMQRFVARYS
ncbi:MAG: ABC transporter permease subunit, partial [Planctomycetes bacterium]|nr:ABC transporter permease subunit [Planctomycetota bacterium]